MAELLTACIELDKDFEKLHLEDLACPSAYGEQDDSIFCSSIDRLRNCFSKTKKLQKMVNTKLEFERAISWYPG